MVERGVGSWQLNKARTAVQTITRILKDGEWHRYQELREKTGLSSATLSKHLKELEKGVVEKKIQLKSGEYPYPVVYRIKESYRSIFKIFDIPDARVLGKKTRLGKKKMEEESRKYLEAVGRALSESTSAALNVYAVERNLTAFQQIVDSSLATFYDVAQAIQQSMACFGETGRQIAAVGEGVKNISAKLFPEQDEAHDGEQGNKR